MSPDALSQLPERHIFLFKKKNSSSSSVISSADVPLNKTCEDLLGVFFRRTARVVLLDEQPFLITRAFQIEGVKLK